MQTSELNMHERLMKIVAGMGSPTVVLVGDFMLDSYVYGDAERISPEAPVPVLKVVRREQRVGGAGSVAADMLALGARVHCVGVVGDDPAGRTVREKLAQMGADVEQLLTVAGYKTTCKERMIGLAQHRHRQQLLRVDEELSEPLPDEISRKLLDGSAKLLRHCQLLTLEDYNKGVLGERLCRNLIQQARGAGIRTLVDPARLSDYSKYAGSYCVTPNRTELALASGVKIDGPESWRRAAEKIIRQCELQAVLLTLDKDGAFVAQADGPAEHVPTRPRLVYDNTGAGDMVLSMLAVALANDCELLDAARLCNIAGGLEVEKFGCVPVSREEIINELLAEHRSQAGKLRSMDQLLRELEYHRSNGRKIAFTNGCFDIIHAGHISYLQFCKQQADVLVVGLNSDSSVRQIKGPGRPINNQQDRATVLTGLEAVDYVVIFDEPDPLATITAVRPDVLIKGEDWRDKGVVGSDFVRANGGKVVLAPLLAGKSTTAVIDRIKQTRLAEARLATNIPASQPATKPDRRA